MKCTSCKMKLLYLMEGGSEGLVLAFPLHQNKRGETVEGNPMEPLLSDLGGAAILDQSCFRRVMGLQPASTFVIDVYTIRVTE